jgi:lysophospholipase L1-like esterase
VEEPRFAISPVDGGPNPSVRVRRTERNRRKSPPLRRVKAFGDDSGVTRRPKQWRWTLVAGLALAVAGCPVSAAPPSPSANTVRYVALGDSYTIGTSVDESERWPNQLVDRLADKADLELVANLGVNGYASFNLIHDELPQVAGLRPDFVTVLIGVNDVVRGTPADAYRSNLNEIFSALLDVLPADRIVVVSTPDYTRTPAGASFGDPAPQRAEIANFNGIERSVIEAHGIAFVDISSVADRADVDPTLVARDGLHPSGAQYAQWVDLIEPVVANLLAR